MTDNFTTVIKVETSMGFPSVTFRDKLNGRRNMHRLYRRSNDGFYYNERGAHHGTKETRPAILTALNALTWADGRDCLASAPWLTQTQTKP